MTTYRVSARFNGGPLHGEHRIVDRDEFAVVINAGEKDGVVSTEQGVYRWRAPTVNPRVYDWSGRYLYEHDS